MSALDALNNELTQQKQQQSAPAAPPKVSAPAAAPAPMPAAPAATEGGSPLPGSQLSDFLSLSGPGWKGSTQGMQDWGARYANDATWGGSDAATPGDLVALRNARMSLPAKMSADIAAQFTAPQNVALNRIPFFGGALQGGGQAATQAYMAGKDLPTIVKEGAAGTAAGFGSQVAGGAVAKFPKMAAPLAAEAFERAPQTALGIMLGHSVGPEGYQHATGAAGALAGLFDKSAVLSAAPYLKTGGDWVRQAGDRNWSAAKPAVRSLLLGLTNTGLQQGLPNVPGQWIPGQ